MQRSSHAKPVTIQTALKIQLSGFNYLKNLVRIASCLFKGFYQVIKHSKFTKLKVRLYKSPIPY
jgi:hypothetical protein